MQKLISRCSKVSSSWQSSAVKQVSSAIPELTADAPQEREQFLLVTAANIESQRYLRARLAGSAWRTVSDAAMGLRCHYKILQEGGELLSPCVCRGSAKCARSFRRPVHQILQRRYVHVDCIEAAFRARGLLPQPSLRALCDYVVCLEALLSFGTVQCLRTTWLRLDLACPTCKHHYEGWKPGGQVIESSVACVRTSSCAIGHCGAE